MKTSSHVGQCGSTLLFAPEYEFFGGNIPPHFVPGMMGPSSPEEQNAIIQPKLPVPEWDLTACEIQEVGQGDRMVSSSLNAVERAELKELI